MEHRELIPHLYRTEYRKIASVLSRLFGIAHIEIAEDIVSDTFLLASETWGQKGLPPNPTAWLYTVSKNKAIDFLKHNAVFDRKITADLKHGNTELREADIDLSTQNINDSQLQMMFALCHPCIPAESQIGLSLRILCGFSIEEIADAFLTNKETINKRLYRSKEKLREENVRIEMPPAKEINNRLDNVLTTLYLLFSEGYYSSSQHMTLRKDLCLEAMRLSLLLVDNAQTDMPPANALLSLMCFHASRFEARINKEGEMILYEDQDESLWDRELIAKGEYYLSRASTGDRLSKYHLEAAIAYWHTHKADTHDKWENILQLYNRLLQIEYSPIAALNRTYALSKANGKQAAIIEAEKLKLDTNHLYHTLLAELYDDIDRQHSMTHLQTALDLAKTQSDRHFIASKIETMRNKI